MIHNKWDVRISRDPMMDTMDIYVYRYDGDKLQVLHTTREGDNWISTYEPGEVMQPTIRLFGMFGYALDFMQTLADQIYKAFGIQASGAPVNNDVLSKMDDHLQDMRRLVFHDKE